MLLKCGLFRPKYTTLITIYLKIQIRELPVRDQNIGHGVIIKDVIYLNRLYILCSRFSDMENLIRLQGHFYNNSKASLRSEYIMFVFFQITRVCGCFSFFN